MPHPADPNSTLLPVGADAKIHLNGNGNAAENGHAKAPPSPSVHSESSTGQELWVYGGNGGLVDLCLFFLSSTEYS